MTFAPIPVPASMSVSVDEEEEMRSRTCKAASGEEGMVEMRMMALGLRVSRECFRRADGEVVRGLRIKMGISALSRIRSSTAVGVEEYSNI